MGDSTKEGFLLLSIVSTLAAVGILLALAFGKIDVRKTLGLPPQIDSALLLYGQMRDSYDRGRFDESLDFARRILKKDPDSEEASRIAAASRLKMGDATGAAVSFDALVKRFPDDMTSRIGRARAFQLLEKTDAAERDALFVLKHDFSPSHQRNAAQQILDWAHMQRETHRLSDTTPSITGASAGDEKH